MSARASLLLITLPVAFGVAGPTDEDNHTGPERLRQTGIASGHVHNEPREDLCELAEDRAWRLVWAHCPEKRELTDTLTSGCITTDYIINPNDDRGPLLHVEVQVEYRCE